MERKEDAMVAGCYRLSRDVGKRKKKKCLQYIIFDELYDIRYIDPLHMSPIYLIQLKSSCANFFFYLHMRKHYITKLKQILTCLLTKQKASWPSCCSICMKLSRGSTQTLNEANTATPHKTPKSTTPFPLHVPHMQMQHSPLTSPINTPNQQPQNPQLTYTTLIIIITYHTPNMARLTILLALFAALLFVAHASRWPQESSCERELENVNLRPCENHIMQRIERDEEEEEDVLSMRGRTNYIRRPGRTDHKQSCCDQLSELEENSQCMCEALQQIMENQRERLQRRSQVQQLEKELRNLPKSCGFRSPRGCDLRSQD